MSISLKLCSIADCNNRQTAKSYCQMHYQRYKKGTEMLAPAREKHGLRDTPEYSAWSHMLSRCYVKSTKHYNRYGGRGISVCDSWRNSFITFLEDMGQRPSSKHTLERVDNDGDYNKDNCVWATYHRQGLNRGLNKNNTSGAKGVGWSKQKNRWVANIKLDYKICYLGSYLEYDKAVAARKAAEKVALALTE